MRNHEGVDLDGYEAVQMPAEQVIVAQRLQEAGAACKNGMLASGLALAFVLVVL